ncbi:hypothetical protein [Parafrankia sp. CH37]|uniref:hypothetical protein n=1 Tax=Parafrankia sp. CH37 TaxID=683308 RepID=UPI001042072E|nr:hypothetical protein [Parafrankia sp. CH37]
MARLEELRTFDAPDPVAESQASDRPCQRIGLANGKALSIFAAQMSKILTASGRDFEPPPGLPLPMSKI